MIKPALPARLLALLLLGSGCLSSLEQGKNENTTDGSNGTGASGTGGGRGTGFGGGASAGSSGGTGGGALCNPDLTSNQLDFCDGTGTCGCPYLCVNDPLAALFNTMNGNAGIRPVCEAPCSSNDDCATVTACLNGVCSFVPCGGNSGNGTYNSTCTVLGQPPNAGTCYVLSKAGAVCIASGSAEGNCHAGELRSDPSDACLPGSICQTIDTGSASSSTCIELCDGLRVFCPDGEECSIYSISPRGGTCIPLPDGG